MTYRYTDTYERTLKSKAPNISTIILIKKQWQVTKHYETTGTEEERLSILKVTYKKWWEFQKEAPALREEFLASKMEESEKKGDDKKAKEI